MKILLLIFVSIVVAITAPKAKAGGNTIDTGEFVDVSIEDHQQGWNGIAFCGYGISAMAQELLAEKLKELQEKASALCQSGHSAYLKSLTSYKYECSGFNYNYDFELRGQYACEQILWIGPVVKP